MTCTNYQIQNSKDSSVFAIIFNIPALLVFAKLLQIVRIKIKLLQDPMVNLNYNMLTMHMYQTIYTVSIIRIIKAIGIMLYSIATLIQIHKENCYNYDLLTVLLQVNIVITYIEMTFDAVIMYLITIELLAIIMIILREKKSTLPELYFIS